MKFRASIFGIIPIAVLLLNGTCTASQAASLVKFSILYNTEFKFPLLDEDLQPASVEISSLVDNLPTQFREALPENLPPVLSSPQILDVSVTGSSVALEPLYGLTNFTSKTYGLPLPPQIDPETGNAKRQVSIFRSNPADLNLNLPTPEYSDVYFGGDTKNKLFGFANDQAIFDYVQGTVSGGGIITIVGGEGIFKNATGRIEFIQQDRLGPPNEPVKGQARLDFSIEVPQAVPEPRTQVMLIGLGIMGVARFLKSRLH
ncbi:PEP-CTERM sorting domain-containing protein [Gloeothece verrucosa]|uniref:Ice-binding protein C-terminal domain-containing protein n=1 Tax=Gloeothece verrucosa (strain PCC 7822) TaxID=497965 RepID=E0U5E0_GLOV7|nr:PEP-CTERM sorting domain-containing protein [Gloeothece verrucosa]ADN13530.1 hypothetical protein Cyan7822_1537 [Gloeothece verrucosa PCC 7822]